MDAMSLPSQGEQPSITVPAGNIALWYPDAASRWSLIFTPAFGAWIHAKNWSALGEETKAQESMYWFYSTLILVAWMFTFLPMELGIATVGLVNGIWHFDFAKSQIEYINKKIDDVYERKSWRQPVGNATACLILAVMFKIDLASHVCR